jgi:DNA-binding NarL/FixJ family response regulator
MVMVVYSSGLALSGMVQNPLVSNQPDREGSGIAEQPARARSALALTEREQDVVALVKKGMTNRQVASELYISSKAVEYHLRNVFGKLGVTSRSALRAN